MSGTVSREISRKFWLLMARYDSRDLLWKQHGIPVFIYSVPMENVTAITPVELKELRRQLVLQQKMLANKEAL